MDKLDKRRIFNAIKSFFIGSDGLLVLIVFLLLGMGLVALYLTAIDMLGWVEDQVRNILLSLVLMRVTANLPRQTLMRFAMPLYTVSVTLLIGAAAFGLIRKGVRRWLSIGVVAQPSEIMKIAMSLMLAWYLQECEGVIHWYDYLVAALLLLIPMGLITKQSDLGTALLVLAAGIYMIYFAGLSWRLIVSVLVVAVTATTLVVSSKSRICAPGVNRLILHDYQQHRVCTLLDPTTDPLGKGFHAIQSITAIGLGGVTGKGWLKGAQTHLEFIPEKHTDSTFAVYSEEFGLVGDGALLFLYLLLVLHGLFIAANAGTLLRRPFAGSTTLILFIYTSVNMGMVSGTLPVVGVPPSLISYGGAALVTPGMGVGTLMSVTQQKRFVQT